MIYIESWCFMRLTKTSIILAVVIVLLVFQSVLEIIWGGFSYIDESVIVIACILIFVRRGICNRTCADKKFIMVLFHMCIFLGCGSTACIVYKYQKMPLVLQDLIANVKFYFAIVTGFLLLRRVDWDKTALYINKIAITISYIIFCIFIVDRFLYPFGGQYRYGIRSAVLLYPHSTYLAGAMAFLLVCIAATYCRKDKVPVILDAIVMMMTLRSKAIVATVIFLFLLWNILIRNKKLKVWQIVLIVIGSIIIAWSQISYYFVELSGRSARSILLSTSIRIMKDYFPLGTGFGTFASHSAAVNYSPVYIKYGFSSIYEVSNLNENAFLDDTFWPIIIGQTGFIGTIAYIYILFAMMKKILRLKHKNKKIYVASLYIMLYLFISSMAEPAFNNSIAVPLGVMLGLFFRVSCESEQSMI